MSRVPSAFVKVVDVLILLCACGASLLVVWAVFEKDRVGATDQRQLPGWEIFYITGNRIGDSGSPYQLVVWTDYQCPACKRLEREIASIRRKLGDSLSVVYHHFPLTGAHAAALGAAIAAECAARQGQFQAMHSRLFETSLAGIEPQDWSMLAREANVEDNRSFVACMDGASALSAVRMDAAIGVALNLTGTPGILIGDRLSIGGRPANLLLAELKSARATIAPFAATHAID